MLPCLSNLGLGVEAGAGCSKIQKASRDVPRRVPGDRARAERNPVLARFRETIGAYAGSDRADADALLAIGRVRRQIISLHESGWIIKTLFRDEPLSQLVVSAVREFVELVHADQQATRVAAHAARMQAASDMPRDTEQQEVQRRAAIAWETVQDPRNTRLINSVTVQASELLGALPPGWATRDNSSMAHAATRRASERLQSRQAELDGADKPRP